MHWTVGEPWYVTRDRVDRLLTEVQPWQLKFAFLPVNIQDNEWVWLEYYERQPVYTQCGDGVRVYRWRLRSALHPTQADTEAAK